MTRHMVDSLEEPSAEQADLFAAEGYHDWGFYVLEWAEESVRNVERAGIGLVPIVAPPNLDGDAHELVKAGVAACRKLGLEGALALDTERFETGDPRKRSFVNTFNGSVRAVGWEPINYRGAGYSGSAADWIPAWTAASGTIGQMPSPPGEGSARQWAGDVVLHGVLVDLNLAGDRFPRANAPTVRVPNVDLPTLFFGHRGVGICSMQGALNAHVRAGTTPGPMVAMDGIFGRSTLELLRRFQESRGIGPWDWCGPESYEHLFPFPPSSAQKVS